MIRRATLLSLVLAGALSLALFALKYQVQDLEEELAGVNRAIIADQQSIHVLKAEWSHLNTPARLRPLAKRYLELSPVEPAQLGTVDDLPARVFPPAAAGRGEPADSGAPVAPENFHPTAIAGTRTSR